MQHLCHPHLGHAPVTRPRFCLQNYLLTRQRITIAMHRQHVESVIDARHAQRSAELRQPPQAALRHRRRTDFQADGSSACLTDTVWRNGRRGRQVTLTVLIRLVQAQQVTAVRHKRHMCVIRTIDHRHGFDFRDTARLR